MQLKTMFAVLLIIAALVNEGKSQYTNGMRAEKHRQL